jgi:hypothetical protein
MNAPDTNADVEAADDILMSPRSAGTKRMPQASRGSATMIATQRKLRAPVPEAAMRPPLAQPTGYASRPRRPSQSWRCLRVFLEAARRICSARPRKMRRR